MCEENAGKSYFECKATFSFTLLYLVLEIYMFVLENISSYWKSFLNPLSLSVTRIETFTLYVMSITVFKSTALNGDGLLSLDSLNGRVN